MEKYDKSLLEVWEWKEKVYQDVKDLTAEEYVEKVRKDADKILSNGLINLTPVALKKDTHKIT
jgi:ribosomal protein L15